MYDSSRSVAQVWCYTLCFLMCISGGGGDDGGDGVVCVEGEGAA